MREKSFVARVRDDSAIWIFSIVILIVVPLFYRVVGAFILGFNGNPDEFRAWMLPWHIGLGCIAIMSFAALRMKTRPTWMLLIAGFADLVTLIPVFWFLFYFVYLTARW